MRGHDTNMSFKDISKLMRKLPKRKSLGMGWTNSAIFEYGIMVLSASLEVVTLQADCPPINSFA